MVSSIKIWLKDHDNKITFTFIYVSASLFLSVYISIFWLVFVVFLHGLIEFFISEDENKLFTVVWHLKLDIVLIIFAILVGVYFEAVMGAAGIGGAARSISQASTRFLAWQRSIRGILLSIDDAAQIVRGALKVLNKNKTTSANSDEITQEYSYKKTNVLDILTIGIGIAFILLIILAPFIIDTSYTSVLTSIKNDINPFPN